MVIYRVAFVVSISNIFWSLRVSRGCMISVFRGYNVKT